MGIRQYNFNDSLPLAPTDAELCGFQKVDDLDTEVRSISMYTRIATLVRRGLVKPDGSTIRIDSDGTISASGLGAASHTEPIVFNGDILYCNGDVIMIGVDY